MRQHEPQPSAMPQSATLRRIDEQRAFYSRASRTNRRYYKSFKATSFAAAALVPLAAGIDIHPLVTGALGVVVVILEGLQHLNQYQMNWLRFRSANELLKREEHLYQAKAGDYAATRDPLVLLAERVEEIIGSENSDWKQLMQASRISPREGINPGSALQM